MGRKAHITEDKFSEFIESVPENAVADGYWKIKKENINKKTGGVIQSIIGYMPFEDSDGYDQLKEKVLTVFAEKHGPAVYYALPCDERKKEVKGQGLVKFEFTDKEVDMPETDAPSPGDHMKHLKKMQKDSLEMQSMEFQKKWMEKMMDKNDKEEEEVSVPSTPPESDRMSDMMMWKMFAEDKKDPKAEQMDRILARQAEFDRRMEQRQGESDRRMEALIEKMGTGNQDNAFQGMMALMIKQGDERDRARQEEERRRQDQAIEDRRYQAEQARIVRDRELEQARIQREKDEDRIRTEQAQLREARKQTDQQAAADRERFEKQLVEERRRFDEELNLRRMEMKSEEEKGRRYGVEQQKFQLQLLDIFKNNKDQGMESTTRIVETLTNAGLTSMTTAQKAAESIIDIAQKANPVEGAKDEGIGSVIRDVGAMALPLLAGGGPAAAPPPPQAAPRRPKRRMPTEEEIQAYAQAQAEEKFKAMVASQETPPSEEERAKIVAAQEAEVRQKINEELQAEKEAEQYAQQNPSTTQPIPEGGIMARMIQQYLQTYPEIKESLLDNLEDNLGPEFFVPVITGLNQDTLNAVLANMRPARLMEHLKAACTPEECAVIDKNEDWFKGFRLQLQDYLQGYDEDEEELEEKVLPNSVEPVVVEAKVVEEEVVEETSAPQTLTVE